VRCKPCGDSPCNSEWCSFTEKYRVTCKLCGQVSMKTWKQACEDGPDCCDTMEYEVEGE